MIVMKDSWPWLKSMVMIFGDSAMIFGSSAVVRFDFLRNISAFSSQQCFYS